MFVCLFVCLFYCLLNVTCNDISVIYVTAHRCAGGPKKKDVVYVYHGVIEDCNNVFVDGGIPRKNGR